VSAVAFLWAEAPAVVSPPARGPRAGPALDTRGNKCARRHAVDDPAERAALRQRRRGGQAKALARAYDAIGEAERAAHVRGCGLLSVYACADGCGELHARHAYHCRERLCVWCSSARGAQLGEALLPLVSTMAQPWFLTLTVKNGPDLVERAAHLRRAFKKLRRRAWWVANVAGGIAVEEVTRNYRTGDWHPHLHLIVDAGVPQAVLQAQLVALWASVTGDSFIIDVRPFQGATVAHDLRELCKYTAKISDIVDSPALVRVYLDYARRRRLIVTFGNCYGAAAEATLAAAELEEPAQERTDVAQQPCPSCGAVGTLRHEPSRRWRMDSAAPVGGGWYVQCRSVEDWRSVRARRGWVVMTGSG
jgi:hypothetical protein